MQKIDFHSHCDSGDPEQIKHYINVYEERGVVACLSGGLFYGGHDMLPNEEVIKLCAKFPGRILPIAKITLWDSPPDPAELYHYAEMGVVGFKFIYPFYEYDHDLYMPVYETAEKIGLPLLFHTGKYRQNSSDVQFKRPVLRNMAPVTLDRIARSFPKLHIVMAHLGTSLWREEAAELVKLHPNLYADLAGSGSWMALSAEKLVELFADTIFDRENMFRYFRKLIFGSDAYTSNPDPFINGLIHYETKLASAGVPEAVIREIMGGTVGSWIGM